EPASTAAGDPDDEREADDDLGGRDHHREEGEHLAGEVVVEPGERDERQVHRVELELDRHEDQQGVLPGEHPDGAEHEQDPGDHEVVRHRCPHDAAPASYTGTSSTSDAASISACVTARVLR